MAESDPKQDISKALAQLPSGLFILTARSEDTACGILVSWVQQTCFEPPMVSVAIAKGRPIMPLISQTRQFGLCQLAESDKLILRRFSSGSDPSEDPFLSFEMLRDTALTVPILAQSMSYLECQVACHIDVEGDHDLFVGRVVAGKHQKGTPWVHVRKNGFAY